MKVKAGLHARRKHKRKKKERALQDQPNRALKKPGVFDGRNLEMCRLSGSPPTPLPIHLTPTPWVDPFYSSQALNFQSARWRWLVAKLSRNSPKCTCSSDYTQHCSEAWRTDTRPLEMILGLVRDVRPLKITLGLIRDVRPPEVIAFLIWSHTERVLSSRALRRSAAVRSQDSQSCKWPPSHLL